MIVCLYRAHQRWAPEIQNAADFVSGLGDRGNYGISSCACAVSFRETGGKGMGTMPTLMCCGLYNPHLISPSQYPSKVALTPLYRWGNGGSVKCSSLLKDAQLKSNGAGSGALLFDSKPHVFNNRAIVLPVIRKGLGKHEPILMLGYNRNHLLSMRSMCM